MLGSLVGQTIKPSQVIIVDDNSTDNTPSIIKKYVDTYPWITTVNTHKTSKHSPGAKVIEAFYKGYEKCDLDAQLIGKFDADIILPSNYLEKMIGIFASDNLVGMASGNLYIKKRDAWIFENISEKISALRLALSDTPEINKEIVSLENQRDALTKKIYSKLSIWQTVQVARHPQRPHTLDFIKRIFNDFDELHGDRQFGDDAALVGGMAYLENTPVMIIGHEKGRETEERVRRNFGMPQPEGYRKAKRLMQFAEQFSLPVITFIDTAGAYPGIEGEERGQSEAIATNLAVMSELKTPIIVVVTGEGGSGGALAISIGDHLSMLEYATYSVASPEACASIIWRTPDKAPEAANAMKVCASELKKINVIDEVISEPVGGAHRDFDIVSANIKASLVNNLTILSKYSMDDLLQRRYKRLLDIGA